MVLTWKFRHVHVSLRDNTGTNVFSLAEVDGKDGRKDAQYEDTRYLSQEGEWFLAGILDGIADGLCFIRYLETQRLNQCSLID